MSTRLLAETNGDISIVQVHANTRSYMVVQQVKEKNTRKMFFKSQGKSWELFVHVEDATKWIMSMQPQPVVKKIQEGSREYDKRLQATINYWAPEIQNCAQCGSPNRKGYMCTYCGKE